ncbi:Krr1-domain-containing protein [Decorospora gaudefroyi]|uniref:Krr1-domain-containing protein n=1 Tax=Decorospora gaudefroyi TaxID=184978 RepID=A0A6A5JXI1_9PLEO|nr:Krr1-domain-containing protein [Decorospora gaudefroyi]
MTATKAKKHTNGVKRELNGASTPSASERPGKKAKLLDNTDDEGSDSDGGGVSLNVNEEYARRFEYNKKRAEQHRLEEKYGKGKALQDGNDDSEDSEEGVEEDDAADLLDEALDEEVNATLQALRAKDPRIYNKEAKFYRELDDGEEATEGVKKQKAMTLRDYHTKNLLEGKYAAEDDEDAPKTYAQEQEEARQDLLKALNGTESGDEDDFIVAKERPKTSKKDRTIITADDVEKAEQDPETFLSNFMASRAWVPAGATGFQPLESDDEDEDAAADEWENSYNLYFEDTAGANEKIMTYARDAVASTTVRRDDKSGRKKARELARAKREAERKEKEQDLARLRKLKMEEMENKVKQIRQIGGLSGRDFKMEDWKDVLEADWSDEQWDAEMQKRFGDAYYEQDDAGLDTEKPDRKKSKKPKKPKFDDDIDIKDLIPDFNDDDDDEEAEAHPSDNDDDDIPKQDTSQTRKAARQAAKISARRDKRLIETLVNDSLEYESALTTTSSKKATSRFRYRDTSPTTFGLTARDILLADDKALNEFAGLKKLAAFRDPVKKKKDAKYLGKKARLRKWRLDTFGDVEGPPTGALEKLMGGGDGAEEVGDEGRVVEGEKRKKKRSRKRKAGVAGEV